MVHGQFVGLVSSIGPRVIDGSHGRLGLYHDLDVKIMNLRTDQSEDVLKIILAFRAKHKAFLLCSKVGLGKSRVCCAVAESFRRTLIVAPLSTFGGWEKEARVMGLRPDGYQLINYESLHKLDPLAAYDLIVFDECQKFKSRDAKRFKYFLALRQIAKHLLFVSATPGVNPLDLSYLGDIFGFDPVKGFWKWAFSFKGVRRNVWKGVDFMPGFKSDTERLNALIVDNPLAIRRTPQELQNWPELQRVLQPVLLDDTQRRQYDKAFKDYLAAIRMEGRKLHNRAYAMVMSGQFRKRISFLKAKTTADFAKTLLEQGMVVVISCEYLDTVAMLEEELKGYSVGKIIGETKSDERKAILEKSARDELSVILTTVNEGINLHQMEDSHRNRVHIISDIRWSAIAQSQCEGRVHRAGRNALVYWMVASDTIDMKVAQKLVERMKTMGNVVGEEIDLEEIISFVLDEKQDVVQCTA